MVRLLLGDMAGTAPGGPVVDDPGGWRRATPVEGRDVTKARSELAGWAKAVSVNSACSGLGAGSDRLKPRGLLTYLR